jgi:hypothetical protein
MELPLKIAIILALTGFFVYLEKKGFCIVKMTKRFFSKIMPS